ncbi:MAG: hypothetical protein ACREBG_12815 [Pyrinomonadaceae bacterium]
MKTSLIIVALALLACLACLVWLGSRPDEPFSESISGTSGGPAFEVRVERPRMDRPFGGILPTKLEAKLSLDVRARRLLGHHRLYPSGFINLNLVNGPKLKYHAAEAGGV